MILLNLLYNPNILKESGNNTQKRLNIKTLKYLLNKVKKKQSLVLIKSIEIAKNIQNKSKKLIPILRMPLLKR